MITHICSKVPCWQCQADMNPVFPVNEECREHLWHMWSQIWSGGVVGTVIREVFPIFQLALSSPVNWDSKAQNDRWEKREDECWRWGLWWMTSHRELYNRCWKFWMVTWDLGTSHRTQEFSWNWRWQAAAKLHWSAPKARTRKELVFSFKINISFHICLEGGTMSWAAK